MKRALLFFILVGFVPMTFARCEFFSQPNRYYVPGYFYATCGSSCQPGGHYCPHYQHPKFYHVAKCPCDYRPYTCNHKYSNYPAHYYRYYNREGLSYERYFR